jgi:predicted MFS family arabinose efflux permease
MSLYGAILVTSLSALPYLFYAPYPQYMPRAILIESVGTFLVYAAYLPLMDMAVRSTPKGSEALGYSLLISVWNIGLMIGTKTGPWLYERVFDRNMNSLIWLNAGVTLAGVALVFVLPKKLVERREGS